MSTSPNFMYTDGREVRTPPGRDEGDGNPTSPTTNNAGVSGHPVQTTHFTRKGPSPGAERRLRLRSRSQTLRTRTGGVRRVHSRRSTRSGSPSTCWSRESTGRSSSSSSYHTPRAAAGAREGGGSGQDSGGRSRDGTGADGTDGTAGDDGHRHGIQTTCVCSRVKSWDGMGCRQRPHALCLSF